MRHRSRGLALRDRHPRDGGCVASPGVWPARVWGGCGRFFFGNFNGVTDEVRLAEGSLTAQRIKTEYLSERDGLVRYGDREAFPAAP